MSAPLSDSISNILGVKIPYWLWKQFNTRSEKGASEVRDEEVVKFITNKTAWVRMVSSIDIKDRDLEYFQEINPEIRSGKGDDLAKQYVLFGGTSKYLDGKYSLRSGLSGIDAPNYGQAYGIMGENKQYNEMKKYGYRPMPGIVNVNIETQGRLGSVRSATINFKCWDKDQLDIMDALYFKLGYSMFLEWGQTVYFPSEDNEDKKLTVGKVAYSELASIDPFNESYRNNKELLYRDISKKNRETEGNYDAMLGIVTNFNFSMNQEGGYDCMVKLISLGVLGDSIKVNNSGNLASLLRKKIKEYDSTLDKIRAAAEELARREREATEEEENVLDQEVPILQQNLNLPTNPKAYPGASSEKPDNQVVDGNDFGKYLYIKRIGQFLSITNGYRKINLELDSDSVKKVLATNFDTLISKGTRETGDISDPIQAKYEVIPQLVESPMVGSDLEFTEDLSNRTTDLSDLSQYYSQLYYYPPVPEKFELAIRIYKGISLVELEDEQNNNYFVEENAELLSKIDDQLATRNYQRALELFRTTGGRQGNNDGSLIIFGPSDYVVGDSNEALGAISSNGPQGYFGKESIERISAELLKTLQNPQQDQKFELVSVEKKQTDSSQNGIEKYEISVETTIDVPIPTLLTISNIIGPDGTKRDNETIQLDFTYKVKIKFSFTETDFIRNITSEIPAEQQMIGTAIELPPPQPPQNASTNQTEDPFTYLSNLELSLRLIQVDSLVNAIELAGAAGELAEGEAAVEVYLSRVVPRELWNDNQILEQIFSNGIFSKELVGKLINGTVTSAADVDSLAKDLPQLFELYAKYGFATKLLSGQANISDLTAVNYKQLLMSYVLPYNVNQQIEEGTPLNHPVYIPFGLFLMLLNHSCTLYNGEAKFPTPVVYIDFNPELNFCLTTPIHLTTDPFVALIPLEGNLTQYKKLFKPDVLAGDSVKAPKDGEPSKLFVPRSSSSAGEDAVSGKILQFIDPSSISKGKNRGRIMNILVSVDYLCNTIKQFAKKDGENKVFLKPLIDQVILDVNKALGNFNVMRLSYNDPGNVFQIVDDQVIPPTEKESTVNSTLDTPEDPTKLPLFGKKSVATSLEIKTEVSTKLANMLAISANGPGNQSVNSTDSTSFGFVNYNFTDRYISQRGEVTGSAVNIDLDGEKQVAAEFNKAVTQIYSRDKLDEQRLSTATNYYIDKLAKNKSEDKATRASAMIPVSLNFTTDGISGLYMGQAFTIDKELLPYTYSIKKILDKENYNDKVGFVITGLTHAIEGNTWKTSVKTNMIFLKDKSDYTVESASSTEVTQVYRATSIPSQIPNSLDGCERMRGTLDEPIVSSTIIKDAYGNYVKGKKMFVAKLEQAYKELKSKGITLEIGDNLRSFELQKSAYEQYLRNVELQKQGKPWVKNGITYPATQVPDNVAHPCQGYHVLGQAVDLVQSENQKNDIASKGPIYQALYATGLRRIPNEWWHWSLGEVS